MRYVLVLETSDDVNDRVNLSYVRKELVAQALALARTLDKPRDIDEFDACGSNFFTVIQRGELREPFVGNGDYADVRFYRAERKVCRLRACMGDRIEKSGFADVGQSYYA